jgi:hypothetical protein
MVGQPHAPAVLLVKNNFQYSLNRKQDGKFEKLIWASGTSLDPAEIPTPHFPERSTVIIMTILARHPQNA